MAEEEVVPEYEEQEDGDAFYDVDEEVSDMKPELKSYINSTLSVFWIM